MSEKHERRSTKRIDCYNKSVLNSEIEHSLVIDISTNGAGLLVEKDNIFFHDATDPGHPVTPDSVHLTIFHPDESLDKGLVINAEAMWIDHDYSSDHNKLGVKFVDITQEQATYINRLITWINEEGHYFFHCEIEKR